MKILFISTITILVLFTAYFIYLGIRSQSGSAPGLVNGKLAPCPNTPNCFCSEYADDQPHFTDAIPVADLERPNPVDRPVDRPVDKIEQYILSMGGKIQQKNNDYLAATFSSRLFRYVDDFEIRIDREHQLIHLRSASRVGRSDFGANLKRINAFKQALTSSLPDE